MKRLSNSLNKLSCVAIATLSVIMVGAQAPKPTAHATAHETHQISATAANAVALKKFGGKIVGKTKLENEDGVWQYGVLVMSKNVLREVMVNAKTGRIDSIEKTSQMKERAEAIEDAKKAKAGKKGNLKKGKKEKEDGEKDEKGGL